MANEYLTRTPTSSGNRRTWTLALWLKRNIVANDVGLGADVIFNAANTAANSHGTDIRFRKDNNSGGNNGWNFYDFNGNAFTWGQYSDVARIDPGNWFHAIFVFNSTTDLDGDRVRVYINGVLDNEYNASPGTFPTLDYESYVNSITEHYIGVDQFGGSLTTSYSKSQFADIFLVDGQALTPDVFGFFKDGDGYISVGSTMSTDFRPGQWVPKKPSVIKNSINKSGGFGVNGFYLPMNDSSNFGADFHCDPNTIITLQDETAAQPKNGAPTTSDSYVSQLRTDANASNIVLAIPGITGGQGSGFGDYSADIKGSGSNKTVTANGDAGIAATASYYGSALNFDGTGDYFTIPANTSDLIMGSDDFTIEAWVNKIDTNSGGIFGLYENTNDRRSYLLYTDNSNDLTAIVSTDGTGATNTQLGGSSSTNVGTNQWNHCALEREGSYLRLYLNGVVAGIATDLSGSIYENTTDTPSVGCWFSNGAASGDINGYIQDLRVYKGVAKYKGSFDVAKPYTPVGIATFRQVPDNCKNNFATLNPLNCYGGTSSTATLTNGNLTQTTTDGNRGHRSSTIGITTGKWYAEVQIQNSNTNRVGVIADKSPMLETENVGFSRSEFGYLTTGTYGFNNALFTYGATYTNGDVIGIALNRTDGTITFFKNGTSQGIATDILNNGNYDGQYFHFISADSSLSASGVFSWNFGQNPTFSGNVSVSSTQRNADVNGIGQFRYAPPADHLALCEDNLPTPAIADPGEYFKTVLYRGDGIIGHSITGVGFKPDLVWIKSRTFTNNHHLFDSVRGPNNILRANTNDVESNPGNVMTSFDNDGFTVGEDGGNNATNDDGNDFVAWCWQAGAGTTSSNTDGSINSVVSVNQEAGFSIVEYDGNNTDSATVGHGLGKVPDMIIIKNRDAAVAWGVWHSALSSSQILRLNVSTEAQTPTTAYFQDENNTSSVFSLGTNNETNSTERFIAYCWAEIEGFSKFGSYTGNADADGPFVYCGFKPAWVMIKRTDASNQWQIQDTSLNSTNPTDLALYAEANNPQEFATSTSKDFLSNGFKIRGVDTMVNADGGSYIFMAFAESPFQTANAK